MGTCVLCGATGLTIKDIQKDCPNAPRWTLREAAEALVDELHRGTTIGGAAGVPGALKRLEAVLKKTRSVPDG